VENLEDKLSSFSSGAKARAEITPTFRLCNDSSRPPSTTRFSSPSSAAARSSQSTLLARDSTSTNSHSGLRMDATSPGKPAPVPKSSQGPVPRGTWTSNCALSAICRCQTASRLAAETRFCFRFSALNSPVKHSSRSGQRIAFRKRGHPAPRFFLTGDHAASRLACTSSAASAAGVTPGMRPAAASVAGRAALSRSTISRERPGIDV